jgi:GNAT superfamily N-acetyltransferase
MGLPAGYELRAPTTAELDAVADVLVADDLDEAGQAVLGADFLREDWNRAGFDLATDAWVVVDGVGTIVAYGRALREGPDVVESWGVVHPEHRGRGIGSAVLDRVEERTSRLLAERSSARFRHVINSGDRAAAAMLEGRGLRPIRHFWHMQIDLVGPVEPGLAPEGIEIAGIELSHDLPAVHAVLTEAFADEWEHHPEPFDRWADEQTSSPSHDPTLWLLARAEGEPAGALTANVWGDRGWVREIGVLAPHRGRGIGEALLRDSFAVLAGRGLIRFQSEEEAVRIANDTPYGLCAYFFTRDLARSWRVGDRLESGIVGINTGFISTEIAPFGGVKESGIGREGSKYGIEEFLETKYRCIGEVR